MRKWTLLLFAALIAVPACEKPKENKKEEPAKEKKADETKTDEAKADEGETKTDEAAEKGSVVANPDGGQWVKSPVYGVEFLVPDEWVIKIEDDGISATDADESTTVVLVGSKSQGMIQDALNNVKRKVEFKDAKLQDTKDAIVNGLPAQNVRGTAVVVNQVPVPPEPGAKVDPKAEPKTEAMDQEIQFIAYNVQVGKGGVTMMIFSQAEMYEAKRDTIEGIAKTLKRLK